MPKTDDAEHWLKCSDDGRVCAKRMHDPVAKRMMLNIADGYAALAKYANGPSGPVLMTDVEEAPG